MKTNEFFVIRPLRLCDLAFLYNVSKPTVKKWLRPFRKELGKQIGHFYSIAQVTIIFKNLGSPVIFL